MLIEKTDRIPHFLTATRWEYVRGDALPFPIVDEVINFSPSSFLIIFVIKIVGYFYGDDGHELVCVSKKKHCLYRVHLSLERVLLLLDDTRKLKVNAKGAYMKRNKSFVTKSFSFVCRLKDLGIRSTQQLSNRVPISSNSILLIFTK